MPNQMFTKLPPPQAASSDEIYSWVVRTSTANAIVATVLGSIPAYSDTVDSEGRPMKQCWNLNIVHKNKKSKKSPFKVSSDSIQNLSQSIERCLHKEKPVPYWVAKKVKIMLCRAISEGKGFDERSWVRKSGKERKAGSWPRFGLHGHRRKKSLFYEEFCCRSIYWLFYADMPLLSLCCSLRPQAKFPIPIFSYEEFVGESVHRYVYGMIHVL